MKDLGLLLEKSSIVELYKTGELLMLTENLTATNSEVIL